MPDGKTEKTRVIEDRVKAKLETSVFASAELNQILQQCEKDLIKMSMVETKGGMMRDLSFYTPIFRYIWLKLNERKMRRRGGSHP